VISVAVFNGPTINGVVFDGRAPISEIVHATLPDPLTDLPVDPIVNVRAVCHVVAVVALPLNAAVTVPAEKLPEASRNTMVLAVFALVAFDDTVYVAAPEPLYVADPEIPFPDVFMVRVFRLLPRDTPEIVPFTHDGAAAPLARITWPAVPAARKAVVPDAD
jgi:hypothetical protein